MRPLGGNGLAWLDPCARGTRPRDHQTMKLEAVAGNATISAKTRGEGNKAPADHCDGVTCLQLVSGLKTVILEAVAVLFSPRFFS